MTIDVTTVKGMEKALRTPVDKATVYTVGGGLYLRVRPTGAGSWVFASAKGGRRRELGLGPANKVSLADARAEARSHAATLDEGGDPFADRAAGKVIASAPPPTVVTFGTFADDFITAREPTFRNEKHRQQWRNTLKTHAAALRAMPISDVGTNDVLAVLAPIWTTTPETATRLRGRIERILDAAAVAGLRDPDRKNPATWKGHLALALPPKRKRRDKKNHPAMPYAEVPAFVGRLRGGSDMSAQALEFTILTAARTGETIGARRKEFDLAAGLWTIPAERMKAGLQHIVPLSPRALAIIQERATDLAPNEFVFPGAKPGAGLSNMAMLEKLRGLAPGLTVHGFRASFRMWAADETDHPSEAAEFALAHVVGDQAKAAYFRTAMVAKRRLLMSDWAEYVARAAGAPQATATAPADAPRADETPGSSVPTKRKSASEIPGQSAMFD